MDYQLTGPMVLYPDAYHEDPYFGDPSPELDQRWLDRLRCKRKAFKKSELHVCSRVLKKIPTYASLQKSSRATTKAGSSWVTGRDISQPRRPTTPCTASDSSTRPSTRAITSPKTRTRSKPAETLTPVRTVHPFISSSPILKKMRLFFFPIC